MKTTKNEEDQKQRWPKTKMTKNRDDQKLRQPKGFPNFCALTLACALRERLTITSVGFPEFFTPPYQWNHHRFRPPLPLGSWCNCWTKIDQYRKISRAASWKYKWLSGCIKWGSAGETGIYAPTIFNWWWFWRLGGGVGWLIEWVY